VKSLDYEEIKRFRKKFKPKYNIDDETFDKLLPKLRNYITKVVISTVIQ